MPGQIGQNRSENWIRQWIAEPAEAFRVLLPGPMKISFATPPASGWAGTVIGRTAAEATTNTAFGLAATGDTEVYVVAFKSSDDLEPAVTVVRTGSLLYYRLIPGWDALSADVKTLVRGAYRCLEYPISIT